MSRIKKKNYWNTFEHK